MASRPVTFVAGVLAGAALTSLYSTQPARHEVPAPVASAAAAPGHAMLPDGFSSAASGSRHPPAGSALTADEGEAGGDDEGEVRRSVPQPRPCSVGWRGASVQGLGLGLGLGATVLCTRARTLSLSLILSLTLSLRLSLSLPLTRHTRRQSRGSVKARRAIVSIAIVSIANPNPNPNPFPNPNPNNPITLEPDP